MVFKVSTIALRSTRGTTSLRERQRAQRGIPLKKTKPPVVTIRLAPELHLELSKRGDVAVIAGEILGGICTRGSIDQALSMWGDYKTDNMRHCLTTAQRRAAKKNVRRKRF